MYVRDVPVTVLVSVNRSHFVPKNSCSDFVTPAVKQAWPDGYSGWLPVTSGSHVGSGDVAGFPSVSARWIAWFGRQNR